MFMHCQWPGLKRVTLFGFRDPPPFAKQNCLGPLRITSYNWRD